MGFTVGFRGSGFTGFRSRGLRRLLELPSPEIPRGPSIKECTLGFLKGIYKGIYRVPLRDLLPIFSNIKASMISGVFLN